MRVVKYAVVLFVCVCVYLVFLILPGVGETWDDSGDAGRGGNFAGVDHDEQLHEVVVDFAAAALDDVDILAADAFADLNTVQKKKKNLEGYESLQL